MTRNRYEYIRLLEKRDCRPTFAHTLSPIYREVLFFLTHPPNLLCELVRLMGPPVERLFVTEFKPVDQHFARVRLVRGSGECKREYQCPRPDRLRPG